MRNLLRVWGAVWGLALGLVLAGTMAASANDHGIVPVGRLFDYWRVADDIAVQGNYAYVEAEEAGLQILDISNPSRPRLTSYFDDLKAGTYSLSARGNLAAIYGYGGIQFLDVSNPAAPRLLSTYDSLGGTDDLKLTSDRAYFMSSNGFEDSLLVLDIHDPTHPRFVARKGGDNAEYGPFAVNEQNVFILQRNARSEGELAILDAGQADTLRSLSTIGDPDSEYFFFDLRLQGNYVYILSFARDANEGRLKMVVADVSHPENPQLTGSAQLNPVQNNFSVNLAVDGDKVYYLQYDEGGDSTIVTITTLDVSNPANPVALGTMTSPFYPNSCQVRQNLAYCAALADHLQILSLQDPTQAQVVGSYMTQLVSSVAKAGDYAYVCTAEDGLRIIDVSQPANPVESGIYMNQGTARCFTTGGGLGFLSMGTGGVEVLDLSEPARPQWLSHIETEGSPRGTTLYGHYLLIADSSADMLIADISNPASPEMVSGYRVEANQIAVRGDTAYVAGADGLVIFDLSDPARPTEIGEFGAGFTGIALLGDRAYLANPQRGMFVLDVSNAAQPVYKNLIEAQQAASVSIEGNYCLLASWYGINTYYLLDPDHPLESGSFDTRGVALDAVLQNGLAYVADWTNFGIYDCSGALGVRKVEIGPVNGFVLNAPYPNPFNSSTTITYDVAMPGLVRLGVYDALGRFVRMVSEGYQATGSHAVSFSGEGLATGNYLLRLDSPKNEQSSRSITYIK